MPACNTCGCVIAWRHDGDKFVPINPVGGADHRPTCTRAGAAPGNAPNASGKRNVLIVIDTETTGLYPDKGHEVVQVAGVALDAKTLQTIGEYSSWMAPVCPEHASQQALDTHGKSLEWLATQRDSDVVRREFQAWVSTFAPKPIPVGYNLPFDLGFLETWGIRWNYAQIDVMQLVGLHLWLPGHVDNRKLVTAAARLGIPLTAHDALADARATAEILRRFAGVFARGLTVTV